MSKGGGGGGGAYGSGGAGGRSAGGGAAPGYVAEQGAGAAAYERALSHESAPKGVDGAAASDLRALVRGTNESSLDFLRSGYRAEIKPYAGAKTTRAVNDIATGRSVPAGSRRPLPPIVVNIHPKGTTASGKTLQLQDGRHRLEAAQKAGATRMRATIRIYGPRGGIKWQGDRIIRVPKADPNNPHGRN